MKLWSVCLTLSFLMAICLPLKRIQATPFQKGSALDLTPFFLSDDSGKTAESIDPFYTLRLTPDDCKNISTLIENMADLNLFSLLRKSKQMKKLGRKLEPVHPLRFLGWIFSNPELKKRMPKIQNSYFRWSKFTEGLFGRLSREARDGNIDPFIPGFAHLVCRSCVSIEEKADCGDWAGMLDELMH